MRARPSAVTSQNLALLLSGGIGDYMHYVARWDSFLAHKNVASEEVMVVVESTAPAEVRSTFEAALPGVALHFIPSRYHWTKTHPLLNVLDPNEHRQRPAFRYVQALGFGEIVDWFLPFCCDHLPSSA